MRRKHVGCLLLYRPRSHNSTEEEARPAICHHAHRRDRSQIAGFGCKLFPPCLTILKPKLNKVLYAPHIGTPSGRPPPFVLGIIPRRTGSGRYVFETSSARKPANHASRPCSSMRANVIPSTPGAPALTRASR